MIGKKKILEAGKEIMSRAAIEIPRDYKQGIQAMVAEEKEELSRFVLQSMLENWDAAEQDRRAMCADTGVPRYFVKAGNDMHHLYVYDPAVTGDTDLGPQAGQGNGISHISFCYGESADEPDPTPTPTPDEPEPTPTPGEPEPRSRNRPFGNPFS